MPMPLLRLQMMSPPQTPLEAAMRACAGSLGLVLAYSCSYNLLLLAPSIYLLQIYDRVLSSRSADTLLMLTLIVAFTVVVGGVLDALRRAAMGRIGAWLEDRLRPAVLSACFEYAYRSDPARASEAYRDLTTLRQFAESGASPMLFDRRSQCAPHVWPRICRRLLHGRSAGAVSCSAGEEPWTARHGCRKRPRHQGHGNARWRRTPRPPGCAGCEERARGGPTSQ